MESRHYPLLRNRRATTSPLQLSPQSCRHHPLCRQCHTTSDLHPSRTPPPDFDFLKVRYLLLGSRFLCSLFWLCPSGTEILNFLLLFDCLISFVNGIRGCLDGTEICHDLSFWNRTLWGIMHWKHWNGGALRIGLRWNPLW